MPAKAQRVFADKFLKACEDAMEGCTERSRTWNSSVFYRALG